MNRRSAILMLAATPIVILAQTRPASPVAWPQVAVHKAEACRCCKLWILHLEQEGFSVKVVNDDNLRPIKERLGIPPGKEACHTAEVNGYFVEGHVPAEDIKRLLRERPEAKGLTAPGMPEGSPGMETPSGKTVPYDVLLVATDGSTTVYAHHD